jgi:hypothetical protein
MKLFAFGLAALICISAPAAAQAAQSWCQGGERPLQGSLRLDQVFVPTADVQDDARAALKAKPFEPLDAKLADKLGVPEGLRVPNAFLVRTGGFPSPQGMPTVEVYFDDRSGQLEVQTFSLSRQEKLENFAIVVVAPEPIKRLKSYCFAVG